MCSRYCVDTDNLWEIINAMNLRANADYFEWERAEKQKTKYGIRPAGSGLMFMAGIYRVDNGRSVFAILSRHPVESISFIHNRMPILLTLGYGAGLDQSEIQRGRSARNAILDVQYHPAE